MRFYDVTSWHYVNLDDRKQEPANMSSLELGPVIFGGTEGIITFMRNHGLLAQSIVLIFRPKK